jgi:hypothetical protein
MQQAAELIAIDVPFIVPAYKENVKHAQAHDG